MAIFSLRLELALAQGTALAILSTAGCGGTAMIEHDNSAAGSANLPQKALEVAGAGEVAGASPSAIGGAPSGGRPGEAGVGGEGMLASLEPYPAAALGCTGESQSGFGYHGQCCAKAYCYTPSDGACVSAEQAPSALGRSYGSGSCLCAPIAGPYAANPSDTPASAGSCCYLIGAIGCDGRPLLVDGRALTSELELRADWIENDLLELLCA